MERFRNGEALTAERLNELIDLAESGNNDVEIPEGKFIETSPTNSNAEQTINSPVQVTKSLTVGEGVSAKSGEFSTGLRVKGAAVATETFATQKSDEVKTYVDNKLGDLESLLDQINNGGIS